MLGENGIIGASVSGRWGIKYITEDSDGHVILTLEDMSTEEDAFRDISWVDLKEKLYLNSHAMVDVNEFQEELYQRFPQAKNLELQIDVGLIAPMSSEATIMQKDEFGNETIIGYIHLESDPFSDAVTWWADQNI